MGGHLGAGIPGADHHEGAARGQLGRAEITGPAVRGGRRGGHLDLPHEMVAQRESLPDAAEPERMIGQARDREQLADAAHGKQQPVVGHGAPGSLGIGEPDAPAGDVDFVDRARHSPDPRPDIGQRHRDQARVKYPGRHLGQQRQVEEVVSRADQDDLDLIRARQPAPPAAADYPGQRARGVKAGEAAADDDNPPRAALTAGGCRNPPRGLC